MDIGRLICELHHTVVGLRGDLKNAITILEQAFEERSFTDAARAALIVGKIQAHSSRLEAELESLEPRYHSEAYIKTLAKREIDVIKYDIERAEDTIMKADGVDGLIDWKQV